MILVSQAISKAEEVSIVDNQSIQHTRWNCIYHIVFIPKYRRKIMYGEVCCNSTKDECIRFYVIS